MGRETFVGFITGGFALVLILLTLPAQGAETVTVVGKKLKFHPNTLRVPRGETVTVQFKNKGFVTHSFHVNELDVHSRTIAPDESTTVSFQVGGADTYAFTCEVAEHKVAGMKGTIEVVEDD